ncbi:sigma-54 interaction domain-containing protein [Thermodesulfobacteriota bacterium]
MEEHEINSHWKNIINTVSEGLMLVGIDGKISMVNKSFEKITGYEAEEAVGRPCTLLNCDACEITHNREGKGWCNLFNMGRDVKKRCVIMKKDGTYLPALKNASLLKDDKGLPLGAVETFADISEFERLDQEFHQLSIQFDSDEGFHGIIGKSSIMQNVFQVVEKAAQSDAPVIISGESGTGKELVAMATHRLGRRRDGPFVKLNCAALNEALLESELFGHVKGAFTGAYRHRQGRFEAAHGGDIFLDEIGDIPLSIQVKLLHVLETKQFERVGDHRPISVDVRIITATNSNLPKLISQKRFREDLFFRINVIPIHLPPLRERTEDIPLLVNTFVRRLQSQTGKKAAGLSREAMELFMGYHWPGNVRELKTALEYAFVISETDIIGVDELPPHIRQDKIERRAEPFPKQNDNLAEKEALIDALRKSSGNQSEAARILGISRVTVWNRMRKYGIDMKRIMIS